MNQVPRSLDKYVTSLFHLKLEAIRQNDLLSLMIAEKILKGEQ